MRIDIEQLQSQICSGLCRDIVIDRRPDGRLMLRSFFKFPDGDQYPIYLSEGESGGIRLSDEGHTLMQISYSHDIDRFIKGARRKLIEQILAESGVQEDRGTFFIDAPPNQVPEALFVFGQSITRIYDLTLHTHKSERSKFYDQLSQILYGIVDKSLVVEDFHPEVPGSEAYEVDFYLQGKGSVPVFLYGVPNQDKARLTTINLLHFHRHNVAFESIIVFRDQQEIPRLDLARLSNVGGEMIASLNSRSDFNRKLAQRVAMV